MNLKQWQRSKKIKAEAEAAAKRTVERVLNAVKEPAMSEFKEYKVGDMVVFKNKPIIEKIKNVFEVKKVTDEGVVIGQVEIGGELRDFHPIFNQIRKAEPEEIAAGHRIDTKCGNLFCDEPSEELLCKKCKARFKGKL